MRQKQQLEDDAAATKKKMEGANALLGALAGEETRWTEQSKAFDDRIQRLTGVTNSHLPSLLGALQSLIPLQALGPLTAMSVFWSSPTAAPSRQLASTHRTHALKA